MDLRSTFIDRHIGPNDYQINSMLLELGYKDLNEFIQAVVPKNILINNEIEGVLPVGISESAAIAELRSIANENSVIKNFIGSGYVGTITPPVVLRNVLENPAWYTAYTPYQPEISQGRLEAIFAFQTVIADLTGLPIANASMLDEATAAAEAMTLCRRAWQGGDDSIFLVDQDLHQHVKAVISTRAKPLKIEIKEIDANQYDFSDDFFGAIFAYPSSGGEIKDLKDSVFKVHKKNALAIIDCDLLSLTLIEAPGEFGADVSVGTAQRFGVPVGFGGPHAGFMSVREGLERSMPGRLVGQSIDSHGNTAFRLALQTREQHIRRDKATSNICTAQVLLAVISAFYAMWHGPQGLLQIANQISTRANSLRQDLKDVGYKVGDKPVFDTVKISDLAADDLLGKFLQKGMNIKQINKREISITFDELTTDEDVNQIYQIFNLKRSQEAVKTATGRSSKFLTHPMFNSYHSETAMLRYIRSLSDRDLALDRTMIPLGSCTMKLNATSEMIPVTWPEFANIHPFAPLEQSRGYKKMIDQLSNWLIEVTGYDAVSLQPNAGSQGEFAGPSVRRL